MSVKVSPTTHGARPTCRFSGLFPSRELFIAAGGTIAVALEANELVSVYKLFLAKNGLCPMTAVRFPNASDLESEHTLNTPKQNRAWVQINTLVPLLLNRPVIPT